MIAQDQLAKQFPEYWYFGIGLLLVVVVLFARGGLLGLADTIVAKVRGGRP
jgi:branched-chain amino acid transport system permease protein